MGYGPRREFESRVPLRVLSRASIKKNMYKEEFFINTVDLITGACIIMELILLFAIFLFLLIKSWISQKKKWSSFSTLILMGHLLSLVFFYYPVERPMKPN